MVAQDRAPASNTAGGACECGAGILACQFTGHPCPVLRVPPAPHVRRGKRAAGMPPELSGWKPGPQLQTGAHSGNNAPISATVAVPVVPS